MSDNLPSALRSSQARVEAPRYYGIHMILSPALRDRLMTVTADVAHSFIAERELQAASTTMWDNLSLG
jgi:hypothetical protein